MRLDLCSWPEVQAYLEQRTDIVIPIGSHEQHGPNGLIGTDAICPEIVARSFGEQDGVMIGPTLGIGVAQHHLGFTGSLTLRPTTLIAVIRDVVASLARHGFTHLLFHNGHGGNIATVQAAFADIYGDYSFRGEPAPIHLRLGNWFMGKRVVSLTRQLYGASNGQHATANEVALTYHAHPEQVKDVGMSPKVAPNGRFRDAADYRARFADGRMGSDPSRATPADGARLLEVAIEDLREGHRDFVATA